MIYPERASERIGEQADVPVPRVGEQIVGALVVGQQQVLLNGRWVTSTGGEVESHAERTPLRGSGATQVHKHPTTLQRVQSSVKDVPAFVR